MLIYDIPIWTMIGLILIGFVLGILALEEIINISQLILIIILIVTAFKMIVKHINTKCIQRFIESHDETNDHFLWENDDHTRPR